LSGGGKLNLQNMGRESKLRDALVAPEGYVICAADLSNIELRTNLALCGEDDKLAIIRRGQDPYCRFAEFIYNEKVEKPDDRVHDEATYAKNRERRTVGKVAELSLGYGSGSKTFRQMLFDQTGQSMWVDAGFASRIVETYREDKPMIAKAWGGFRRYLENSVSGQDTPNFTNAPLSFHTWGIRLPSGFTIKYPNLRVETVKDKETGDKREQFMYDRFTKNDRQGRGFCWHGTIIENCNQALAREVLADIQDRVYATHQITPALQVHDELVFVIPEAWAEWFPRFMEDEMSKPLSWWPELPLDAEAEVGASYGEAK
jgi:DNA polymerase